MVLGHVDGRVVYHLLRIRTERYVCRRVREAEAKKEKCTDSGT